MPSQLTPFDRHLMQRLIPLLSQSPDIHGRRVRGAAQAIRNDDYILRSQLTDLISDILRGTGVAVVLSVAEVDQNDVVSGVLEEDLEPGFYRVNYYLETTLPDGAAGTLELNLSWIDAAGEFNFTSAALDLSIADRLRGIELVHLLNIGVNKITTAGFLFEPRDIVTGGFVLPSAAAVSGVTYSTSLASGIFGSAEYTLNLMLERLG